MIISKEQFKALKLTQNSAYNAIRSLFLYHSNKIEGSTFTLSEIEELINSGTVSGTHSFNDILETRNSLTAFDLVIDTLGEPITSELLSSLNKILFKGTDDELNGLTGHFKIYANRVPGSSSQFALPREVPSLTEELIQKWNETSSKDLNAIARFHARFEHIHPFQDGNGRIGRFMMLKQCIENAVDLVVVTEELEKPYKAWIDVAISKNDVRFFIDVLRQSQSLFDEAISFAVGGFAMGPNRAR